MQKELSTLLLKIVNLVWLLSAVDLHIGLNIAKACFAMLILLSIYLLKSPVLVTLLLRYVNSSTSSIDLLLISTKLLLGFFYSYNLCHFGVDLQSNFVSCCTEKLCLLLDILISA